MLPLLAVSLILFWSVFQARYGQKKPHKKCRMSFETTVLYGTGHAVETMDAIRQSPLVPVKIYLDEIDKLGNYKSIFT